jgi:TatD DNase family protein
MTAKKTKAGKPKIVYQIGDSLFINMTRRCTSQCIFCFRTFTHDIMGHNLRIKKEPTASEILKAIGDPGKYKEVVFCGLGEPTLRLAVLKTVAAALKNKGTFIRLDTNGHGSLIHKRNIVPELKGLVDAVSVSLNAENAEKYGLICKPAFGTKTFDAVLDFIRECRGVIPQVTVTVVRLPEIDLKSCERIALSLGARFKIREYNRVR